MRKIFSGLGLFVLLSSCFNAKYDGYSTLEEGLYFKLLAFSDTGQNPRPEDYAMVSIHIFDSEGNLIQNSDSAFPLGYSGKISDMFSGFPVMEKGLLFMHEGDSMSLIVDDIAGLPAHIRNAVKGDFVRCEIKLRELKTPAEYAAEQLHLKELGDVEENLLISCYLKEKELSVDTLAAGLYIHIEAEGEGEAAHPGQTVKLRYKGFFLGGEQLDENELEFRFGDEMQVIAGIELAIPRMRKGGKAKIIVPSYLAFREKGSSNGMVPPFTPLMYEVELLDIK